jgi:hypothetical protein
MPGDALTKITCPRDPRKAGHRGAQAGRIGKVGRNYAGTVPAPAFQPVAVAAHGNDLVAGRGQNIGHG